LLLELKSRVGAITLGISRRDELNGVTGVKLPVGIDVPPKIDTEPDPESLAQ
jgi:hypothetical protein